MHTLDFQSLVDQFYQPLYRFALSLARNESDACDLTQQTYALWATKGHQLRDLTKVKTWLFTTLYREYVSQWRRQARFPHQELEPVQHEIPPIQSNIIEQLDSQLVMEALTDIEEVFRAPLTLFYLEDHSYKDISLILDVPIGTVMSRISRGKELLRKTIRERMSEAERKTIPFPNAKERLPHG